ncbi:hypothetical protein JTB14_029791 [Gonioctena quinquepunctata]|nr:hypothetical protein JTB14_029791 [Gonioctena quinquepunctata]
MMKKNPLQMVCLDLQVHSSWRGVKILGRSEDLGIAIIDMQGYNPKDMYPNISLIYSDSTKGDIGNLMSAKLDSQDEASFRSLKTPGESQPGHQEDRSPKTLEGDGSPTTLQEDGSPRNMNHIYGSRYGPMQDNNPIAMRNRNRRRRQRRNRNRY